MIEQNNIPKEWMACSVDDLYQIVGGGTPSTKVEKYWNGNIPWITSADIHGPETIIPRKAITPEAIEKSSASLLPENSIIVVTRVALGKVGLSKTEISFSQDSQGLIDHGQLILPKYAVFYLSKAVERFKFDNQGTTISGVTKKQLKELSFLLPPHAEQQQIISQIEELFSELDNGIENLKKAQEQLKIYRQAVLKYAFEGKLTEKWRNEQIQAGNPPESAEKLLDRIGKEREEHYHNQLEDWKQACEEAKKEGKKKPSKPKKPKGIEHLSEKDIPRLQKLPQGWCWTKIENLNPYGRECSYGVLQPGKNVEHGIPMVRVGDINNGKIDIGQLKKIDPAIADKYQRTFLKGREILISLVGAIGRTAVVPTLLSGSNIARAVGVIPLSNKVDENYIELFLRQESKIYEMTSLAHEVARKTLNLEDVRKAKIVLSPYEEQVLIVSEIESRLSVCDQLEQTIEDSLKKSEALRQSILKKAFSGELTREWRKNHPELISGENSAEKLLERIKAEKEKALSAAKPRKTARTKKRK